MMMMMEGGGFDIQKHWEFYVQSLPHEKKDDEVVALLQVQQQ